MEISFFAAAEGSSCWYPGGGSPDRLNDVEICIEQTLADTGFRPLLNHVKQLVASDGHIKVWTDGLSFANAFSHPHVQLRNVEGRPRRDRRWNPAIDLRYSEIREWFARLRTAHNELGDLYVSRLARVCRHDSQGALGAISNRNPIPLAMPLLRWTDATAPLWRTPLMSTWSGAHRDLACLNDLNLLALIRDDAGQHFKLPKTVT